MSGVTNCERWTVRQLSSDAFNEQLLCVGIVTGRQVVSVENTISEVPHDGDPVPSLVVWIETPRGSSPRWRVVSRRARAD
jgi:hypothetical protein